MTRRAMWQGKTCTVLDEAFGSVLVLPDGNMPTDTVWVSSAELEPEPVLELQVDELLEEEE